VLIDRGGRELPISAQIVGFYQQLPANSDFKLVKNDTLELSIIRRV
jgi:pyrimidine operon attenuation protein/uracil phosphoribosyltransferase